ncbi:centromere protein H [Chamaea fasciata]|uniref:centromere protein H n=1 Tax=Chamaea fasciata TaxID=190680 RepID=UPI00336A2F2D
MAVPAVELPVPIPALALEPLEPLAPALEPPAAIPAPAPAWVEDGSDDDGVGVVTLLRLRDLLKEQLQEYNAAVLANQENFIDQLKINIIEEKLIQSATKDMQNGIEGAKISFQNKTLALKRVQIIDALKNKLDQDDEESRLILETMQQIGLLTRTIIEYQQQAHQKEEQMIDIKRKRLSLKIDEGQKIQQIQTMRKMQEKKQGSMNVTERANSDKLEQERQMTAIIQNVFQNIVIGSRVNWAEDPSLKAIVLQLENNVCLQ